MQSFCSKDMFTIGTSLLYAIMDNISVKNNGQPPVCYGLRWCGSFCPLDVPIATSKSKQYQSLLGATNHALSKHGFIT